MSFSFGEPVLTALPTFGSSANPDQLRAIQATDGPLLIIAGPGSGKTFTLVERVVYLIQEKGVKPEQLLILTFTEKAAAELTTRISNRLSGLGLRINLNEMYLGTFHSVCLRWLENHREFTRLKRNYTLLDGFDQQYFIYDHMREYDGLEGIEHLTGGHASSAWVKSQKLLGWINKVNEEALLPATLLGAVEPEVQALGRAHALYLRHLEENNALDFSTIQVEALRLFQQHPDLLADLRSRLTHLMVDEYQDTNTIQEQLLFLLAGDQANLCVVGDDDQGLYRFRGATIRNILEFPQQFPAGACQQVKLTTNYRSHPDIISLYNGWMDSVSWNVGGQSFRFQKTIEAPAGVTFPDSPTTVKVTANTETAYHQEVLDFLRGLQAGGQLTDWNQVAFLFRSVKNPKVTALQQFLEANGIPVYSPRSNQFFEREEVKLMFGALLFMFKQFPRIRAVREGYTLDIWDYYNDCLRLFAGAIRDPQHLDLRQWVVARAHEHDPLVQNADYAFTGLFYRLLQFPLFSRYLDDTFMTGTLRDTRPMRNLALISQLLGKFEHLSHIQVLNPDFMDKNLRGLWNNFIRFLKDGGLSEYEDNSEYAPSGCVSFMTVHQSKGLEFPVVVVGSLDATPRKAYSDLDELMASKYYAKPPFEPLEHMKTFDFWRLYYTAFSRAQNLLVLTAQAATTGRKVPTAYFGELWNNLPDWRDPTFDLQQLPLAQVKDVNLKREYSFTSDLTLFENCAEQYRFFKALDFAPIRTSPILFGTLVHQTIEDIHKTVLRGEAHKLSEGQIGAWFDSNYAYLTQRERVYLAPIVKRLALEHVLRYYTRKNGQWDDIREAEVDVSLLKDEYILTGKIDLIAGEGNTVELVDFKSEKKPDVTSLKDRDKLERYRRQLEVYAHLVEERLGLPVSKTHLYYTSEDSGNPRITFPKNTRSLENTVQTFDAVVHRIQTGDYGIPERPTKLCKDCDMRHYCDRKNWTFRSQE
jgi:DNA helicase-2/ATP-dependent DNA helicase PcrA